MKRLILAVMIFSFFASIYASNPFFAGKKNPSTDKTEVLTTSKAFLSLMKLQRELNQKIVVASKKVKEDWKSLFPLIFLVFAYGVIHAIGPGHGKVFSIFYFMSEKVTIARGILLSMIVGFFHGLMGVLLVVFLKYILQIYSYLLQQNVSLVIQRVSFFLISLLGLYFFVRKFAKRSSNDVEQKGGIALAFSVSMVPCPGVVMIMLFCISNDALPLGLLLSGFMSLGMALTIASVGLLVLNLRKLSFTVSNFSIFDKIRVSFDYFFAFLLFLYGTILFIGSL